MNSNLHNYLASGPVSSNPGAISAQGSGLIPNLSPGNPVMSAALFNGLMSAAGSVGSGLLMDSSCFSTDKITDDKQVRSYGFNSMSVLIYFELKMA